MITFAFDCTLWVSRPPCRANDYKADCNIGLERRVLLEQTLKQILLEPAYPELEKDYTPFDEEVPYILVLSTVTDDPKPEDTAEETKAEETEAQRTDSDAKVHLTGTIRVSRKITLK